MPDDLFVDLAEPLPRRRGNSYDDIVDRHAQRTNLDPELIRAVIHQESGGNPRAVSSKGAQGIGQLMPATAKRFGVTDPFDPEQNIRGATDYLKFLSDRFGGNRDLVLAGYNAGEGAVDRFGGIPPYKETRNYVKSINARLGQQSQQPPDPFSDLADDFKDLAESAPPTRPPRPPSRQRQQQLRAERPSSIYGRAFGPPDDQRTQAMRQVVAEQERQPIEAAVRDFERGRAGSSGMGELHRLDDPEATRITRLQRQVRQDSPILQLRPSQEAQEVARRAQVEREDEVKAIRNEPRVAELTQYYRQQIRDAARAGTGITPLSPQWTQEMIAKTDAGLTQLAAGLLRPFSTDTADSLAIRAQALQRAAEEEGVDRNRASKAIQNVIAGTITSLPEMAAMRAGVRAPVAFGVGGAVRSYGRGERPQQVVQAGAHGAATGVIFEAPAALGITNPVAKVGTIGAGTGGLELATGQPPDAAIETGLTNAAMAGLGEIGRPARPVTQPTNRLTTVEGRSTIPGFEAETAARAQREGRVRPPLTPREVEQAQQRQSQPETPVIEPVLPEVTAPPTHHSARQPRRQRGEGKGRFKRGKPVPIEEPAPVEQPQVSDSVEIRSTTDPGNLGDRYYNKQGYRVTAHSPTGEEIGSLAFTTAGEPIHAFVEPAYRRQGVATKLYTEAERVLGKPLARGSQQSPEGKAFRTAYESRRNVTIPTEQPTVTPPAELKPQSPATESQQPQVKGELTTTGGGRAAPPSTRGPQRNFRAGANNASLVFNSEIQRDLYDLGAKMRYQMHGGRYRAGMREVGDVEGLRKRLIAQGVPESEMSRLAFETFNDIKAQMRGVKDGEIRKVKDNVSATLASSVAGTAGAAPSVTEPVTKSLRLQKQVGTDSAGNAYTVDEVLNRLSSKVLKAIAEEDVTQHNPHGNFSPATAAEKVMNAAGQRAGATNGDWRLINYLNEPLGGWHEVVQAIREKAGAGSVSAKSEPPISKLVSPSPVTPVLEPIPATTPAPPARPPRPTSARQAEMNADRAELDLLDLPQAERRSWQETLDRAKERGTANASTIAEQVLNKPRSLNDVETGQLVLRAQEIKNELSILRKEIVDDPTTERLARSDALQEEFNRISEAARKSGTQTARALVAHKLTINRDYDLTSLIQRATEAKGRKLTPEETQRYEQIASRIAELETQVPEVAQKSVNQALDAEIAKAARQRKRAETKQALDDEFAQLKQQFQQARAEAKNVQASGLAGLDPEGKLTPLIARMAKNRIKAGVKSAEALITELYETVKSHGWSKDDVAHVVRSTINQSDDVLSRWDKRRQAQLIKQQEELTRRLDQRDFSAKPPRQPPIYNREVQRLQEQVQSLKNKFDLEMEREQPGHWWRQLSALRKSWMLSGLSTQAKNIGGTGGYQVFEEVARLPAAIADAAAAPFTGRRTLTTSPAQMLDAVLHARRVGLPEAGQILRRGATPEQLERHQFSEIDTGVKAIDYASNLVFRFMSASDRIFYQYSYKRNLNDRAMAQAKNEGKGRERARELSENPPEELDAAAKHDALVSTFNNNNKLSDAIKSARARLGAKANFAIDLIMPFDRTPTNVIGRVLEASPVGLGQSAYRAARAIINKSMTPTEQRQFSQTLGRATVGTAILALGWKLADDWFDVEDNGQVYLKVGEQRYNLNSISPVGNLLATGAKLKQDYKKLSKEKAEGKPLSVGDPVKTLARTPLDQPLLRAGSEVTELLRDPERSAARTSARLASSFIPFGGAARDVAKTLDPEERRFPGPRSFTQQVQQGIPVLRQRLPVTRSKVFQGQSTSSPATKEIQRLDMNLKGATQRDDEPLQQFEQRQRTMDPAIVKELERLVQSPAYQRLPDEERRKQIRALIQSVASSFRPTTNTGRRPARPSRRDARP